MTKFPYRKGRLAVDPRGAHVMLNYQGRTLLGTVVDAYWNEFGCSGYRLRVQHFNGDMWPMEPSALAVDVLEREYESADAD